MTGRLPELPHKGPGEFPAVLEHTPIRPLENGRLDGVGTLIEQKRAEVRRKAVRRNNLQGLHLRRAKGTHFSVLCYPYTNHFINHDG